MVKQFMKGCKIFLDEREDGADFASRVLDRHNAVVRAGVMTSEQTLAILGRFKGVGRSATPRTWYLLALITNRPSEAVHAGEKSDYDDHRLGAT